MADQDQPQERANVVNIQDAQINELHAANVNRLQAQVDIVEVGDIQQAHAEFIHADNVQNLHVHYDNNAPPLPAALQQLQHDAARTMQEEMPSTLGATTGRMKESTDAKLASNDFPCPVYELVPISSSARQDDKREVLRKFLAFQSSQKMKSYEELELFGTLYETNDTDLICSCIKNINFSNESFTTVGMHAMSSVMRRCSQLEFVRLQNCNLNAELVHILKSNLNGSSLKLNKLDVSGNMNLGTDGFRDIGLVVTQCQVKTFVAGDCNLTAEEIKAFKESTRDAKLNQLNVSDNYGLGTDGFGELGLVVSQCHVETFRARECGLAAEGMEAFKKNTRNAKLIDLDVSFNKKLETDGFGELGLVVTQCHVEALFAINCNLTAEKMEAFKENTPNAKLNDLDVSFNKNLGTDCFGKLGLVVTQCHVERFNARYCNLTAEGMEAFKENTPNAKIKFLNLSGNKVSRLGDEGLSTIREIVHQCQVETLAMMECDFNPDQLERFKTLIADTGVKFILQIESTG
ncbi:ribonuclease inhibitor-like isoform X2 [Styela clava]